MKEESRDCCFLLLFLLVGLKIEGKCMLNCWELWMNWIIKLGRFLFFIFKKLIDFYCKKLKGKAFNHLCTCRALHWILFLFWICPLLFWFRFRVITKLYLFRRSFITHWWSRRRNLEKKTSSSLTNTIQSTLKIISHVQLFVITFL